MINLRPEFCRKFKEARREAGLSQSALALEVGCKQSALSMFEQGSGTKLNDDVILRLCKKFGIELPKGGSEVEDKKGDKVILSKPFLFPQSNEPARGFCPNPDCPSHERYEVDGRLLLKPNRKVQDPVGGKYCAICGEILEKRCPNCGALLHDGAICSICGDAYIATM